MVLGGANNHRFYNKSIQFLFVLAVLIMMMLPASAGLVYRSFSENSSSFNVNQIDRSRGGSIKNPGGVSVQPKATEDLSEIKLLYTFPTPTVYNDGYDKIEISGLQELFYPGEPILPFRTAKVLIPPGARVKSVGAEGEEKLRLDGDYKIQPGGEFIRLDQLPLEPDNSLPEPDEAIYESNAPYPGRLSELVSTQRFRGYDIAIVNLFPVEYIPRLGEIYYYNSISLNIKYSLPSVDSGQNTLGLTQISAPENYRGIEKDKSAVVEMVDNPTDIRSYNQIDQNKRINSNDFLTSLSGDWPLNASATCDMVIITNDALNGSTGYNYTFQSLATYRSNHGIKTTIVTVENITSNPDYWNTTNSVFNDTAAQIRNFIIYAYNSWGITYVLLGGDGDGKDVGGESGDNIIPARGLYVSGDNIPADIYYMGLDGNWNNNSNTRWGEYPDECDFFAEVYVGRAPVDSAEEVNNFVGKTLHYEITNDSYLDRNIMIGEYLWPETYGGDYMDEIRDGADTHGYTTGGIPMDIFTYDYNVTTLYDRDWPVTKRWPKSEVIKIINEDMHIIHHLGHSNVNYNMKLYTQDVAKFNNTEYFFLYSQGCYPGAFDNRGTSSTTYYNKDSIGEHFIVDEFGAFAAILNSRYGYGQQRSTNGPSQRYHREFVDALYTEGMRDIGRANQDSKEDSVGAAGGDVMRWCLFESNLFGDPSLQLRLPKPPDHDISVKKLSAPTHVAPSTQVSVNGTVLNRGFSNETNILVNFTVDGSVLNSTTIAGLNSGETAEVGFNWTPVLGIYTVGIETKPITGENIIVNNHREQLVIVEPDTAVTNAVFSQPIYLKEQTAIVTTVKNIGGTGLSNVKVTLFADGNDVYNDTITSLVGGSDTNVTLFWTPQSAGDRIVSIFAQNHTDEHSIEDNYYNTTITVKVRPEIDYTPNRFKLTLEQGREKSLDLKLFNNGTSGLYYDLADYATKGQHRKIALISDRMELLNITDTMDELDLEYSVYNNNTWDKYTQNYNLLIQYDLIIWYSASRKVTYTEKVTLDRYLTEHGGNLIVTGYDSLGSPTDYNMAYIVRSSYASDGPWWYACDVVDAAHPIVSGPFGSLGPGDSFFAANFDHDSAIADPVRGSKSVVSTRWDRAKILVTDNVDPTGAKIAYWNGNRFTQDWDFEGTENVMLLKNMLVWASDDGRPDWLTETPASGLLDFDKNTTLTITVNTSDLSAGTYHRNIVIASNDTDEPSVIIPVELTVPVPDHDIMVKDMSAPPDLSVGSSGLLSAILKNQGTSAENGITVHLKLDGSVVNSTTITNIGPSSTSPVNFYFTPNSSVVPGVHKLEIVAEPVLYENGTFNNKDGLDVNIRVEAIMQVNPDSFAVNGRYDEVVKTNFSVTNSGTGVLKAEFGTYHYVLEDGFVSTTLNTSIWANSSGTPLITTPAVNEPSVPYSLNLDSLEDTVESFTINLTNATYAEISFYLEGGGLWYRPRTTSWIYLEYRAQNLSWQPLWSQKGFGPYVGLGLGNHTFKFLTVELPDAAFHENFRFRFRSYGVDPGYDDWFIDDVRFEFIGQDDWLYTEPSDAGIAPYGASTKIDLAANLTLLPLGVHYNTIYVKSNDELTQLHKLPVTVTVLGELDHIHMSQSSLLGTADDTLVLTSTGHDINDHEVVFTRKWSTTDPLGSVTNGIYNPGKTGTWKVYCNSSDDSVSNFTTVSISTGVLSSIKLNPNTWTGPADSLVSFSGSGYDDDGNVMAFEAAWATTDPLGTVTTSGKYTSGKVGTWTVTYTNSTFKVVGTATVTVNSPAGINRITVTPSYHTMTTDETKTFTAVLYDKYNNIIPSTPSWSVNGGGTIDTAGKFTPTTVGEWTVTAKYGAVLSNAKVIVTVGMLDTIEILPDSAELDAGESIRFIAKGCDADGNTYSFVPQWSVDGGGVVDTQGRFIATTAGEWVLTAKIGSFVETVPIKVNPGPLHRIEITPLYGILTAGEVLILDAVGYDRFDNMVTLIELKWNCPAEAGYFIDPGIFYGTLAGEWSIEASVTGTSVAGRVPVIIEPGQLARLVITPAETEVPAGTLVKFKAEGYDSFDNPIKSPQLTWSVSGGGDIDDTVGSFRAKYVGTWTVTAAAPGVSTSSKVTIIPGSLHILMISPGSTDLAAGSTQQFTVSGYDAYGNELKVNSFPVSWHVSGGGTISASGLFSARQTGTWTATAGSSDKTAAASIKIIPGPMISAVISPEEVTMFVSESVTFNVHCYDEFSNEMTSYYDVSWTLTGGGTITTSGIFTAKWVGDFDVSAVVKHFSSDVTVTASVLIKPASDTDSDGDGMPDVWEINYGLDPNDAGDAILDSDGDGVTNLDEFINGIDPEKPDSDGDGLPDGWELDFGLLPQDDSGMNGRTGDPDGDGHDNFDEYNSGTDPRNGLDPEPPQDPGGTLTTPEEKNEGGNYKTALATLAIIMIIIFIIILGLLRGRKKNVEIPPVNVVQKTKNAVSQQTPGIYNQRFYNAPELPRGERQEKTFLYLPR